MPKFLLNLIQGLNIQALDQKIGIQPMTDNQVAHFGRSYLHVA